MALTILIDKIISAMDKKEHVIGLFLDFAKAFDTVNHDILLRKLDHYGIRNSAPVVSKLFIWKTTNSKNGTNSFLKNITCGVPQGY